MAAKFSFFCIQKNAMFKKIMFNFPYIKNIPILIYKTIQNISVKDYCILHWENCIYVGKKVHIV